MSSAREKAQAAANRVSTAIKHRFTSANAVTVATSRIIKLGTDYINATARLRLWKMLISLDVAAAIVTAAIFVYLNGAGEIVDTLKHIAIGLSVYIILGVIFTKKYRTWRGAQTLARMGIQKEFDNARTTETYIGALDA